MTVIQRLGNPSLKEIRLHVANLASGTYVRSESADKQLIGRMDKTFGLLDCVGGESGNRRYRVNRKGAQLLKLSRNEVLEPLLAVISGP